MFPSYGQGHQLRLWYRWSSSQYQHGPAIAEWLEAAEAADPIHRQQDQEVPWQTYSEDRGGPRGEGSFAT